MTRTLSKSHLWRPAGLLVTIALLFPTPFARAVEAQSAPTALHSSGQRDFDWAVGSWKIHLKRRLHPLTGSDEWVEFDGTVVCHKVWDGLAEVEEFNVDSKSPAIRIQGLALRTYNPESRQWRIYWANSKNGEVEFPPMTGEFKNGRGEFFSQIMFNGRAVFVRFTWSNTATAAPHFEQAYSDDGGETWEANWITEQTKQ